MSSSQPRWRASVPLAMLVTGAALTLYGCASFGQAAPTSSVAAPPATRPEASLRTYLGAISLPGGEILVPPPPATGSRAMARDLEGAELAANLQGSSRWDLATRDADLRPLRVQASLSCAAGLTIGAQTTPALQRLLLRAGADFGGSTSAIKRRYIRSRPFMQNDRPVCTPGFESMLRRDGSYPSGHSAIGYGLSLIVAELIPDRASRIIARGRAYGDSRRICNVHWLSDIEEGRVVATATLMRLHGDPAFRRDLEAARSEIAALNPRTSPPIEQCDAEARALDSAD